MDPVKKTAVEQRLVIGLAGVFVIAFCAGPLRGLIEGFARKAPAGVAAAPADREAKAQDARPPAKGAAAAAPVYTAQDLRDPLESPLSRPAEPSAPSMLAADGQPEPSPAPKSPQDLAPVLSVQGVLWGQAEPKAIIDDRVYGVNDQVGGGTIVGIDHRGVVLDYGGVLLAYQPSASTPSVIGDPYRSGSSNQGR